jgi:hypothetical protein
MQPFAGVSIDSFQSPTHAHHQTIPFSTPCSQHFQYLVARLFALNKCTIRSNTTIQALQWLLPVEEAHRDDFSRRCAFSSLARFALSLAYLSRASERQLLRRLHCKDKSMLLQCSAELQEVACTHQLLSW